MGHKVPHGRTRDLGILGSSAGLLPQEKTASLKVTLKTPLSKILIKIPHLLSFKGSKVENYEPTARFGRTRDLRPTAGTLHDKLPRHGHFGAITFKWHFDLPLNVSFI